MNISRAYHRACVYGSGNISSFPSNHITQDVFDSLMEGREKSRRFILGDESMDLGFQIGYRDGYNPNCFQWPMDVMDP